MTKKNYSKYEAKEELVTLSFNHVLLHKKDTKIYQVIFLSLHTIRVHNNSIVIGNANITSWDLGVDNEPLDAEIE